MTITDPAFGSQPTPAFSNPFENMDQPFTGFNAAVNTDLGKSNELQQIAGQMGGAAELQAGIASSEIGSQEQDYLANLANSALTNAYSTNLAGYQSGQLQLKGQQIGLEQLGTTQEQQLQGVEQPIQTSQLTGGLAAQGALNTKGSQQQQQQLGATQQYTNEQLQNAQKNLGIMATANGMSVQEVQNQLQEALQSSGLSNQMSAVDLVNSIAQTNAGELTGLEGTLSPLFLLKGSFNPYVGGASATTVPGLGVGGTTFP